MNNAQHYLDMATRLAFAYPDTGHPLVDRLRHAASQQAAYEDGASEYCPPLVTLCCQYGQALAA